MRTIAPVAALALLAAQTAGSAETMTVQSLLNDGYKIAGIATSAIGGATIYLQKGNALMFCYATETSSSPTLATQYCKPVK